MFDAISEYGITGRAVQNGLFALHRVDPRDFTTDRHRTVDDRPYGGGPGMVMKAEPLARALAAARTAVSGEKEGESAVRPRVIYLSPQGRPFTHAVARDLAREPALVLLAGRYEGIDERLLAAEVDEELSVGDYVLSGGELPAMVVIDALVRLLPGALGHEQSAAEDSFAEGLLDCPHYTRPERYDGSAVPEVLLSGDHERIRRWRLKQSLARTLQRRPDLLPGRDFSEEETALLDELTREQHIDTH
jgi:tRNA (guanine37-N1)-methyltransferase